MRGGRTGRRGSRCCIRFWIEARDRFTTEGREKRDGDEAYGEGSGGEHWRKTRRRWSPGVDGCGRAGTSWGEAAHLCGSGKACAARGSFRGMVRGGWGGGATARKNDIEKYETEGGLCEGGGAFAGRGADCEGGAPTGDSGSARADWEERWYWAVCGCRRERPDWRWNSDRGACCDWCGMFDRREVQDSSAGDPLCGSANREFCGDSFGGGAWGGWIWVCV